MGTIQNEIKENLVYVDESGIDNYLHRAYGWAVRGQKVYGEVSGKRFARENFIAAQCGSKILAPMCFQGTCATVLFNTWLEQFLLPELKRGQIVIMENAMMHKSEKTRQLIESVGCQLLFLPPYSPDLNPIEMYWANLKSKIKNSLHHFSTLSQAIQYVFNM